MTGKEDNDYQNDYKDSFHKTQIYSRGKACSNFRVILHLKTFCITLLPTFSFFSSYTPNSIQLPKEVKCESWCQYTFATELYQLLPSYLCYQVNFSAMPWIFQIQWENTHCFYNLSWVSWVFNITARSQIQRDTDLCMYVALYSEVNTLMIYKKACIFFRFHFIVVPRRPDRIATPLFYTVYIHLSEEQRFQLRRTYTLNWQEGRKDERGMQRWNDTFIFSQQLRKE